MIVDVSHGIEDHIRLIKNRPNESDPENTNIASKWKDEQVYIFTTLYNSNKGKLTRKTVMRTKYMVSEAYTAIIDNVNKYGAEGDAATSEYDRINTLKFRKIQ